MDDEGRDASSLARSCESVRDEFARCFCEEAFLEEREEVELEEDWAQACSLEVGRLVVEALYVASPCEETNNVF